MASANSKKNRVLIVGAKPGSLGECISSTIRVSNSDLTPVTAGISGEAHALDITNNMRSLRDLLTEIQPAHIVMTAGVNMAPKEYLGKIQWKDWYSEHMYVNVIGPMCLLEAWIETRRGTPYGSLHGHFVVISSNSAHIPRSNSAAYCASKAALSMAVRSRSRDLARSDAPFIAYGYEPGMLIGTPMSKEVEERFGLSNHALHRMPGVGREGLSPTALSYMVVNNLLNGGQEMNGCMFRVDAGES